MSTPGGFGSGDDNPYGGGSSNPYGVPGGSNPYSPYGAVQPAGSPYGAAPGAPGSQAPLDGVSIASFVLSLLCCTGLIGLILGFVGLSRTKNGQRRGRWAAIAGIAIGALAVIGGLVVGAIAVFAAGQVVTPGNAEAGQCVNIEDEDGEVFLTEADCTDEHDGEILAVEEVDDDNIDAIEADEADYCAEIVDEDDLEELAERDDLEYNAVMEDPDDISVGDHIVCYVEGDEKLDEQLLD